MRLWIWRHFRLELPDDWEMLQFSRESEAGRCGFADRYQFRLEFYWRRTDGPPDVERMTSDCLAKRRLDGSMPEATLVRVGAWEGIAGRDGRLFVGRFGRYFDPERCLVEIVFLWPESRDSELEERVLASVGVEPAGPDGLRRWKAFGLDLWATDGLPLLGCRVEPAHASLTFAGGAPERREQFGRFGMVSEWLHGTTREWLRRQSLGSVELEAESSQSVSGHAIETLRGLRRPRGLGRFVGRGVACEAAAWVCPADGRLYHVSLLGPEGKAGAPLAGQRLTCCEALLNEFTGSHSGGQ